MPESGAAEGDELTLTELVDAVHDTGFTIRDDGKGGTTLIRPAGRGHIPPRLMGQLAAAKPDLIALWPKCDECGAEYWWLARRDVGRLCDRQQCPRRADR